MIPHAQRHSIILPTTDPIRIAIVLGTRPEAIKLAPVVLAARARPEFHVKVYNTGQHGDLCRDVLTLFGIAADADLAVMTARQTLSDLTASVLQAMECELTAHRPDWLLVQGDTTTAFATTLAAFYQKISVAHVEAGLRTGNIYSPWPEEVNRRLITHIALLHFAPVELERREPAARRDRSSEHRSLWQHRHRRAEVARAPA